MSADFGFDKGDWIKLNISVFGYWKQWMMQWYIQDAVTIMT